MYLYFHPLCRFRNLNLLRTALLTPLQLHQDFIVHNVARANGELKKRRVITISLQHIQHLVNSRPNFRSPSITKRRRHTRPSITETLINFLLLAPNLGRQNSVGITGKYSHNGMLSGRRLSTYFHYIDHYLSSQPLHILLQSIRHGL